MRPGLSREASRPSGVSTRLGTTRLARIPRAMPSRATCRQRPGRAAFDASYAGIPVAARRLAAELMNTIAEPGSSTGSAAAATRKCALVLTANVSSHWAAVVPAIPRPSPIPTFSTRPSRPPSAAADVRDHRRAGVRRRDVGQHDRGGLPLVTDQRGGRLRGARVAVRAGHRRAFPGRQHRNGPAVADRRIRFRRWPRARADHQHPPPGQPAAAGRGAGGFRWQRHGGSHIGAAPGGSGTANAFSRNEISV